MTNATNRWLDRLAQAQGTSNEPASDYRLAQLLGVERQMVSKLRRGVIQMSDDMAIRVAELVDVLPVIVVTDVRSDRARTEREKKFWTLLGKSAKGGKVAAVILSASAGMLGATNFANWGGETPFPAEKNEGSGSVYYVKQRPGRRGRHWRRKNRTPRLVPGRIRELSFAGAA